MARNFGNSKILDIEKCCFCETELAPDYSGPSELRKNNPHPFTDDPKAHCCGKCNYEIVVPGRLIMNITGKKPSFSDIEKQVHDWSLEKRPDCNYD